MTNIVQQTRTLFILQRTHDHWLRATHSISSTVLGRGFSFVSHDAKTGKRDGSCIVFVESQFNVAATKSKYNVHFGNPNNLTLRQLGDHVPMHYLVDLSGSTSLGRLTQNHHSRRHFFSSSIYRQVGNNNPDDQPRKVKGHLFYIPHPLKWLKSKWFTYLVKAKLDPNFCIDEFIVGAKQALSYLTQLISSENYNDMADICSSETVEVMKSTLSQWTSDQIASTRLVDENILLALPYIQRLTPLGDCYFLHIEVKFVAVKVHRDAPLIFDTILRFTCKYDKETPSDWLITQIHHLKVKSAMEPRSS